MLHEFITDNRDEIISRARARVTARLTPRGTLPELDRGIPLFLTQLAALLKETMTQGEEATAREVMESNAGMHGHDLLAEGLSVAQVVHDYGDVCQVVTELAVERDVRISAAEFRAFNCCLDEAIAHAVTEYARTRERAIMTQGAERLGVLSHELRNVLSTAMLSWDAIKRGASGTGASVGALHTRSLIRLRSLIDHSLGEVRLEAAMTRRERVVVAEFIEEEEISAMIQARASGIALSVPPVDVALVIEVDRQVLAGALANLLQNAFKFTRPASLVSLIARGSDDRVYIDVEDACGGLPQGKAEDLFRSFEQRGDNRTGLGLGLSIARRSVQANGGELRVHNLPNRGCRFTIDLPRFLKAGELSTEASTRESGPMLVRSPYDRNGGSTSTAHPLRPESDA
jgi:signal transduction histidine kinase